MKILLSAQKEKNLKMSMTRQYYASEAVEFVIKSFIMASLLKLEMMHIFL